MSATTLTRPAALVKGRWIDDWRPEDPAFWDGGGRAIARRNLLFSIFSEHIGFSVWTLWSVLVLFLGPAYGVDPAGKFLLTAVPALVGAVLRIPYTFAVARFGGRNWTIVSAGLLLIPAVLRDWMRDLLRNPAKEFTWFEAALSLLPVLPPEEAVTLLRGRALQLSGMVWQIEGQLAELAQQNLGAMTGQPLPAEAAGQKFPPLFTIETEYRLAMVRAEFAFVTELVRRIDEEGFGPIEMWRGIQRAVRNNTRRRHHDGHHAAVARGIWR